MKAVAVYELLYFVLFLGYVVSENVDCIFNQEDFDVIDPGFSLQRKEISEIKRLLINTPSTVETYNGEFAVQSTRKPRYECPFAFGPFPDFTNCKFYYQCFNSKSIRKQCSGNFRFDTISKKCTEKASATCATKDDIPEKVTFECPTTYGSYTYPKDCSKHYLCLFKKASLMECVSGKLFDAKRKECMEVDEVDCGDRPNPYGTTTPVTMSTKRKKLTTTKIPKVSSTQAITRPSTKTANISPGTTSQIDDLESTPSSTIIIHPDSTNSTSETVESTESTVETEESTTSSSIVKEESTSYSSKTNDPGFSTTLHTNADVETTTDASFSFVCPQKKGRFPHETYCYLYYTCKNSTAQLEKCPEGTLFNTKYGLCYTEELVDCGMREREDFREVTTEVSGEVTTEVFGEVTKEISGEVTTEVSGEVTTEVFGEVTTEVSGENSKKTIEDNTTVEDVPSGYTTKSFHVIETSKSEFPSTDASSKLSKDPKAESTEPTAEQESTPELSLFECPNLKGKFPHDKDCSLYYKCKNGIANLEQCADGLMFSTEYTFCHAEDEVDCGKRQRTALRHVSPSDPAFACPTRKGRFAHEERCSFYYDCKNGQAQLNQCPVGTKFETNYRFCYAESGVDCGTRMRF